VAQQDMGEKRANQGEHSGLYELIGRDFGQVQTADHPRNHKVMPGCSPSLAATGSSLGRKLSRSRFPTARRRALERSKARRRRPRAASSPAGPGHRPSSVPSSLRGHAIAGG